ncbi:MAG: iron ABC transporter permease [Mesorhizobium sp.]|uniref:FecCD family ABC transporter permease n=1 Tax=Mesorhizobium sp. TaxID=1871066 RepID=UPI000FE5243B|nr:iron ABC transporter permease [Mesorhizobium sp.]RWH84698.1 MAG: iron ABC transporter permease [Mesorhizobium sp.]RWH87087.1 MAG: iron ABC transporter permease [Mesorhizobium sp.]RWH93374.1 MAG: iron ABC transporter permease [Mesorhizobium sp.]RWI03167.1 MAG: iron ABC transporter permease [Mesorhizobium sp.]RWI05676.1 MAG: iron ABC transporter permease [Mesorhizobium sp.]
MSSEPAALSAKQGRGLYRALVLRKQLILAGLALALLLSLCIDLALGPANYSLDQVVLALVSPGSVPLQVRVVLWDIRLPIALMAVVVGAALSIAGAQMQTILNNPLASPFTLGISAAASFGAALALAFGVALIPAAIEYIVPLNAFVVAMLTAFVIHLLSVKRGVTVETIVLLGIALVFTFNALLALVQYLSSEQALAAVVFWTMGSLTKATWPKLIITSLILLATLPIFARRAWALTALRLGEDKAASFGVKVARLRLETMMMVSLLAAIPVAFVGTIGFIGLVGPHIARMLIGEDQRFFLPASALSGALILSASSVASKSLIPGTIFPIGIVTSLVGIPFFISLILSNVRRSW